MVTLLHIVTLMHDDEVLNSEFTVVRDRRFRDSMTSRIFTSRANAHHVNTTSPQHSSCNDGKIIPARTHLLLCAWGVPRSWGRPLAACLRGAAPAGPRATPGDAIPLSKAIDVTPYEL